MAKRKQDEIPEDIAAMTLEELDAEEARLNTAGLWDKLLKARDEAQQQLHAYVKRKQDVTRAMVEKLRAGQDRKG